MEIQFHLLFPLTEKDFELFESENIATACHYLKPIMGYPYTGKMDSLSLRRGIKEIKSI